MAEVRPGARQLAGLLVAIGEALSGSGPAMFALAGSATEAERIRDAMLAASRQMGIEARGIATEVDEEGVRTLE